MPFDDAAEEIRLIVLRRYGVWRLAGRELMQLSPVAEIEIHRSLFYVYVQAYEPAPALKVDLPPYFAALVKMRGYVHVETLDRNSFMYEDLWPGNLSLAINKTRTKAAMPPMTTRGELVLLTTIK